jgi:26S proteasome regulatory subunit N3
MAAPDQEMLPVTKTEGKDETSKGTDASDKKQASTTLPPQVQLLHLLRQNLALIERAVTHLEPRFTARVLRTLPYIRKRLILHPEVLATAVKEGTPEGKSVTIVTRSSGDTRD